MTSNLSLARLSFEIALVPKSRKARAAKQLALGLKFHGGRRRGAGRPNRSGALAHTVRPEFSARHPLHVTLKLAKDLPSLKRKEMFKVLRDSVKAARELGLRVIHYSVQSNHVHFILEARDREELTVAVKSLTIRFAKHLNRRLSRAGTVFFGRYHLHVLKTARQVKNALRYVLLNREHREHMPTLLDAFSSGVLFSNWHALVDKKWIVPVQGPPETRVWHKTQAAEICSPANTWLLRVGWLKA